ncbi:hypothetical protein GCK72_001968 [Caenorhabditis remanei]|uniref:Uncharacterized protein n=1 Tax=Caenorhabditis remanei TaxID=31234 RepID=A0A6A5HPJ8_CAERE|nr:hypothetical protein GCK72_001968 [Caenorhabditis remanei]KAF1770150.1 hypothetical protein GCK72_001968 [Caenorhabditis remanei]
MLAFLFEMGCYLCIVACFICVGVVGYVILQLQNMKKIYIQNEKILQLLSDQHTSLPVEKVEEKEVDPEESNFESAANTTMIQIHEQGQQFSESEDESERSSEYLIPDYEDSEDESEYNFKRNSSFSLNNGAGTGSSGYNTEHEIDLDWEYFKIMKAPRGPVPHDQILLCFTCNITGFYLKAVVDKDHTAVWILSYEKNIVEEWEWSETTCLTCIEKVRRVLADGECPTPFAIDLENNGEEELTMEQTTICQKSASEVAKTEHADVEDIKYLPSDGEQEDVIEKPIATFPLWDDFEYSSLDHLEYDDEPIIFLGNY